MKQTQIQVDKELTT